VIVAKRADVAVIGSGIVGLAHAWEAARRGLSVALFERDARARGASVRNFGTIWPIGQPAYGLARALRSRERWLELAQRAGLWLDPCGSLHLARGVEEWAVLQEFAGLAPAAAYRCELLTPEQAVRRCPAVRCDGLLGALYSSTEACVDPRQALAVLPAWLAETFGVMVHFGTAICDVAMPHVVTAAGDRWEVGRAVVCSGVDFATLFPEVLVVSGVRLCKLQMMRTAPQPRGWRLGSMLAGGLTLAHYAAFEACPSLPALRARLAAERPDHLRHGVHVLAAQNGLGEVVIGDSHDYDDPFSPFDSPAIDELILSYLREMVELPDGSITERWHGTLAKHPRLPLFTATPQPGAHICVAPGGAGMTLSFGLAEELWSLWLAQDEPGSARGDVVT
jgi:FAD dependent oxidoreductase TIGR03364